MNLKFVIFLRYLNFFGWGWRCGWVVRRFGLGFGFEVLKLLNSGVLGYLDYNFLKRSNLDVEKIDPDRFLVLVSIAHYSA